MRATYLLLAFMAIAFSVHASYSIFSAQSPSNTIPSLLQSYNVSEPIINNLLSVNITYHSNSYTELFLNSRPYILVNVSDPHSYTFVFNTSAIASIIRNNTIQASIGALGLSAIRSNVSLYLNSSAAPLNDCLTETGLDRGATCTLSNYCQSCEPVPACNKVLYETGGPSDVFGTGIMTFEKQYGELEQNLSILNAATNNVSFTSVINDVGRVNFAFSNISSITASMPQNPIFPPPTNADLSQCNGLGSSTLNSSLKGSPWYCNAVGFCQFLSYNSTKLMLASELVSSMNEKAPSNSEIYTIAKSINETEAGTVTPLILAEKNRELAAILNTTLKNYTTTVNKATALLSHMANESLFVSLSVLKQDYATLNSGYLSLNLSSYPSIVALALSNVSTIYSRQETRYLSIVSTARNNTGFLLAVQSSNNPNASLLAFRQEQLNSQIASYMSNPAAVTKNLTTISSEAKALGSIGFGPADLSRATDGPFASALAHALNLPYSDAVAAMPLLASIPSLLIGLLVLLFIYLFYYNLKKGKRIRVSSSTTRAWIILFVVVIILLLVYVGITYFYASQANSNAPLQLFLNAEANSNSEGIVLNGTVTQGMRNCSSILYNQATSLKKKVTVASISGGKCTVNGTISTAGSCLNSFVESSTPFLTLTSANSSSMHVYSMYGTALYASGSEAFMNSCYPALLLR